MNIYKHIEQGVTADHFVLSSMDYPIMTSTEISIFDIYPFLYPAFFAMLAVSLLIWIGLVISVFQARFSPHKFISIQLNIVISILRVLYIFLALWLFILLAWKHTFTVYFFITLLLCMYFKREKTLVKAGCSIIAGFLKFISTIAFLCLSALLILTIFDGVRSLTVSVILLTLFMFSPIFISILFRRNNQTYKDAISLKYIVLTCISAFIIFMIPTIMERL